MKKNNIFEFPQDSKIKIPEKYNEECLKTATMEDITIQDLYNWAKDHNYLDYKIRIKYRDEGGAYFGYDKEVLLIVCEKDKTIKL